MGMIQKTPADSDNFTNLDFVLECVKQEVLGAQKKFRPFHTAQEGWAIVQEECDELRDEVKANNRYQAMNEAIQTAAMAVRFLLDCGTQNHFDNHVQPPVPLG